MNFNLENFSAGALLGFFGKYAVNFFSSHFLSISNARRDRRDKAGDQLLAMLEDYRRTPTPDKTFDFSGFRDYLTGSKRERFDWLTKNYEQTVKNSEIINAGVRGDGLKVYGGSGDFHDKAPVINAVSEIIVFIKKL